MAARYIIGIDLGTTNIAFAYVDTTAEQPVPQVLAIPQVTAAGEVDSQPVLPSFLFLPDGPEVAAGALDLPWATGRDFCVGRFARHCAAQYPAKTISSAKSWLCAPNVDRRAAILPWHRPAPGRQLSPLAASQHFLEHLRAVWDAAMPDAPFAEQELVLTVPASFDAVARELTVEAATAAGLAVTLLEEPQAAFYAWLQAQGEDWRAQLRTGDRVLVCDIGGGTTDFSLIETGDEDGNLALRRVAVGDHILLGGDNMDLTLAVTVAEKLRQEKQVKLDAYQLAGLTHACREAKETLCANPQAAAQRLTVLGRGSGLVAGTISTKLSFADLDAALFTGFFPACELSEPPQVRQGAALRTFGLAYAADPAITRHLAHFLQRHCQADASGPRLPTAVLFNGGVTKAPAVRAKLLDAMRGWSGGDVRELAGAQPDLAVALGASWYGWVRRGHAVRIRAGSPHSYYVGIESSMPAVPGFTPPTQALCVVPFGMEEGTEAEVPFSGLGLVVGDTTEFKFYAATTRPDDALGTVLPDADDAELHALPALATTLAAERDGWQPGTLVPVQLRTVLSAIGTLQLWCHENHGDRQWRLDYELRTVAVPDKDADAAE